jgi:hypothetical protein
MAEFSGIGPETGYSMGSNGFLTVPNGGINFLVLRDGKGFNLRASDPRIAINELSATEIGPAVRDYVAGHKFLAKDEAENSTKKLWATCESLKKSGARIWSVRAKGTGLPHIEAIAGTRKLRVDCAILQYKSFNVGFRFLCHPDGNGHKPATKFNPDDAAKFIAKVNAVYIPQVNIGWAAADSKWTFTQPLSQPLNEWAFRKYLLPDKNTNADMTMFHVGKWYGKDTDPNGTYFDEDKVAVMDDNPSHPKEVTSEGFVVTLCHELAHHIQFRRKLVGHHSRERVLLSTKIQSTYIDKQLVNDLNPW